MILTWYNLSGEKVYHSYFETFTKNAVIVIVRVTRVKIHIRSTAGCRIV